ncbi:MAG: succinylglutamate desuccinylase [Burkholderiaceae bacterium]|nr:MAG: succinylglutamate desuccinylase [Burkholderiaceae bacterium]
MALNLPVLEVLPRDLSAYRQGNVGIDYVHRFESGQPGPHLLDTGVRPRIGTLTISFANVAAYESFDKARPFDSRQLVHNLNRIWSAAELDGSDDSPELLRARQLRPVVAAADHILDIHSTSQDVEPFWVYPAYARNAQAALAMARPPVHLVMPDGLGTGTPLIQHGRHGQAGGTGVALVVECGQHFLQSSADVATAVALDFLAHFGLIEPVAGRPAPAPQRRYELLETCLVRTPDFAFVRPLQGFEVFDQGALIATDGPHEIRALCDGCTILMPTREPIVGREAVYLTRPL